MPSFRGKLRGKILVHSVQQPTTVRWQAQPAKTQPIRRLVVVPEDDLGGLLGHVDVLGEGAVQLVLLLLHVRAELLEVGGHGLLGLTQHVGQRAGVSLVPLSRNGRCCQKV